MTISSHIPDAYELWRATSPICSPPSGIDHAGAYTEDFFEATLEAMPQTAKDSTGRAKLPYPRPPGMTDTFYAAVIQVVAGGRRGTVAIIKQLLEVATGKAWTVYDQQIDQDNALGLAFPPLRSGPKQRPLRAYLMALPMQAMIRTLTDTPKNRALLDL